MFYIIYLHVNQSVDSILITPVNVQIRNDTWDWPFTLITPILSSRLMRFQNSAYIHKVECILNKNDKFPSWTLKFSKVMTLFSMHITKLLTGLRQLIFCNYFAYKTSAIKINEALVLYIPRYITSGVKHNYWNHLLQSVSCLLMSLPYKVKRGVIHTICLITDNKMEYYENFFENEQICITSMYTINNQIIWLANWALQESIKMVVAVA